eukprot:UC1_evm1s2009
MLANLHATAVRSHSKIATAQAATAKERGRHAELEAENGLLRDVLRGVSPYTGQDMRGVSAESASAASEKARAWEARFERLAKAVTVDRPVVPRIPGVDTACQTLGQGSGVGGGAGAGTGAGGCPRCLALAQGLADVDSVAAEWRPRFSGEIDGTPSALSSALSSSPTSSFGLSPFSCAGLALEWVRTELVPLLEGVRAGVRDADAAMATMKAEAVSVRRERAEFEARLTEARDKEAAAQRAHYEPQVTALRADLSEAHLSAATKEAAAAQARTELEAKLEAERSAAAAASEVAAARQAEAEAATAAALTKAKQEADARTEIEAELAERTTQLSECTTQLSECTTQLSERDAELVRETQRAEAAEAEYLKAQGEISRLNTEAAERKKAHTEAMAALKAAHAEAMRAAEQVHATALSDSEARTAAEAAGRAAAEARGADLEARVGALEDEIMVLKEKLTESTDAVALWRAKHAESEARIADTEAKCEAAQGKLDKMVVEAQSQAEIKRKLEHELTESRAQTSAARRQLEDARAEVARLEQQLKDSEAKLAAVEVKLAAAEAALANALLVTEKPREPSPKPSPYLLRKPTPMWEDGANPDQVKVAAVAYANDDGPVLPTPSQVSMLSTETASTSTTSTGALVSSKEKIEKPTAVLWSEAAVVARHTATPPTTPRPDRATTIRRLLKKRRGGNGGSGGGAHTTS